MESKDIIAYLKNAKKKTPVCIYIKTKQPVDFPNTEIYGIYTGLSETIYYTQRLFS